MVLCPSTNDLSIQDDLEGKAWILNGKVFCKDALNKYPLIEPTKGLHVYKNGKILNSTDVICETDVIKIEILNEEIAPSWEIRISDDRLEAYLTVKAGVKISRILKDKKPSSFIRLEVEEFRTPISIDAAAVLKKLTDLSIVHGIDYSAISKACASGTDGTFLIANGTPPTKGKNGSFKPTNDLDIKSYVKERYDGSVDFRETKEFPSVNHGQIIGEVIPPIKGKAGITVTGSTIHPETVDPLHVRAGTGVLIVNDSKVVATETGHPDVKINGKSAIVSVVPKLTFKEVTLETGNVHYLGAVEIKGSIEDSMIVEARGNILVQNNTYRAKVLSGRSIIVQKNVVGSSLTAGDNSLVKIKLSKSLMHLSIELKKMSTALRQLSQVSAFKVNSLHITGLGPLIKILCNSKFKNFLPLVSEIVEKIREHSTLLEAEWLEFANILYKDFITLQVSTLKSEEDITKIAKQAETLYLSMKSGNDDETPTFIKAGFVQNSKLYSSGDIIIFGHGAYNSKLFAEKNIIINGYVRGGEIHAEDSVSINEVGNQAGINVKISVSEKGKIKLNNVSENTTIQVGRQSHTLYTKETNIFAKLDNLGQLQITKGEKDVQL